MEYNFPTPEWLETLDVGVRVMQVSTPSVGEEPTWTEVVIKSISRTGIISVRGSHYTFKDGYRRGFQYRGNCWIQPCD